MKKGVCGWFIFPDEAEMLQLTGLQVVRGEMQTSLPPNLNHFNPSKSLDFFKEKHFKIALVLENLLFNDVIGNNFLTFKKNLNATSNFNQSYQIFKY